MTAEAHRCLYCGKQFLPSTFHPHQKICSAPKCKRHHRTEYHRRKYHADAEYHLVCRESDQKWRNRNIGYQRRYRQQNPSYVETNRRKQVRRDSRRRMRNLVKNNLAIDLKSVSADIWLVGPEMEDLVKNNLAISEVMIMQTVTAPDPCPG